MNFMSVDDGGAGIAVSDTAESILVAAAAPFGEPEAQARAPGRTVPISLDQERQGPLGVTLYARESLLFPPAGMSTSTASSRV